mmetsp:Transcript_16434/g.24765  ORF Transcript_16434/g.24765 Transcript_16434/m.24765 type:complete len:250 (-) Transcript_16434:225-974(-)
MTVCNLFANPLAIFVQGALGVAVFSLLIVKWRCERPRRQFYVWIFDALKQCIAAAVQHACNVAIAAIARSEGGEGDEECGWYIISFTIDAVLGTFLSLIMLKYVVEVTARKFNYRPLIESGDYGQPDNINVKWWGIQLGSWILINVLARGVCGTIIFFLHNPLHPFVAWMTRKFAGHSMLYLLLSMIGTPTLLNIIQLMIQDTVLMKRSRPQELHEMEEQCEVSLFPQDRHSINISEAGEISPSLLPKE